MEVLFTDVFAQVGSGASNMLGVLQGAAGVAQEAAEAAEPSTADIALFTANNVWMLLSAALVFIMSLGFATVEAGFSQAKNTVNVLFKNVVDLSIGIFTYMWFGFNLMYPGEFNGVFGFGGWGLDPGYDTSTYAGMEYASMGYTYWTDYVFQAMFAATCATIVSGAVAERIKISAYFLFTIVLVGLIYPVIGSWQWGYGWLHDMGFYDFAGSSIVHGVGGAAALAAIIVVGPRIGKYVDGKVMDKPGASVPLAVIGVFLLWFGWYGFNGGSVLSADPELISLAMMTTTLAPAGGAIGALIAALFVFKRLDLGMVLNGILAGLVGITAGADQMNPWEAWVIGMIAGFIVVFSAVLLDKLKLDDVVGAVSVHMTCGWWGTIAVGLFGASASSKQLGIQVLGTFAMTGTAFTASLLIMLALKYIMGVRVSPEHEKAGMDSKEHGIRGYTITFDE